jgi:hypothetical protein
MEKDPTNWSIATWALVLGVSVAGGMVNYLTRVKAGHTRPFNLIELIGEIATSAFVGFCTISILVAFDAPAGLCWALGGVGGHMGTRLLFYAERVIETRLKKMIDSE